VGAFSIWDRLIGLLVAGTAIWLLVRYFRTQRLASSDTKLSGIDGWLAFLALCLSIGLLRNIAELAGGLFIYLKGFKNEAARGPLVLVGLSALAFLAANIWMIVALFLKKAGFRRAFLIYWILSATVPLSLLAMLSVPGVTLEMVLPFLDAGRYVAFFIGLGLWYWYLCVSVRVRNTFVN
jgi:hypothetical protein